MLVVDDDEVSRDPLRGLLADSRFAVIEAVGGVEGLRLARRSGRALSFSTWTCPTCPASKCCAGLRGDDATRDVPVIVRTARVLDAEEQRGCAGSGGRAVQGNLLRAEALTAVRRPGTCPGRRAWLSRA